MTSFIHIAQMMENDGMNMRVPCFKALAKSCLQVPSLDLVSNQNVLTLGFAFFFTFMSVVPWIPGSLQLVSISPLCNFE